MANLFARKPLDRLMAEAQEVGEHSLKRSLGPVNLVALGSGGIIGASLFVRTAVAIGDRAGPSIVLEFVVAGIGCTFAGLCYAEFASMIPVAGSAYTYSYATMGEFVAWIIGWDLILEYAVAAATVSDAWSEYANRVLGWFNMAIAYQWTHSPFEHDPGGTYGIMNVPALFILLILTMLLIKGTKESAFVNGLIVILKVSIVLLFIGIGWQFINPANHTPLIPPATTHTTAQGIVHHYGGLLGILGAAGVVFFAYIGFDAVSTAAQEARNPKRDMPIGILGSLVFCTILYVLFSYVLSGVPADVTGEMTSIGTLFAFILVCAGVWIMRVRHPELERGFRVPAAPLVAILGIITCGAMIYGLGWTNWLRLIGWLAVGLIFYFAYGKNHSRIAAPPPEMPEGIRITR